MNQDLPPSLDLSELLATIQTKRATVKATHPSIDDRLVRWGVEAVTRDYVGVSWVVLLRDRSPDQQWWVVRALLSVDRLEQVVQHLDRLIQQSDSTGDQQSSSTAMPKSMCPKCSLSGLRWGQSNAIAAYVLRCDRCGWEDLATATVDPAVLESEGESRLA